MGRMVFLVVDRMGDVTATVMLLISEGKKPQGISTPFPFHFNASCSPNYPKPLKDPTTQIKPQEC